MLYKKTIWVTGILTLTVAAHAEPILTGFEAPDYALNSTLTGSNGWTTFPSGVAAGTIQSNTVFSGSQAVKLTRTATLPATYGALLEHSGLFSSPANPITTIDWDMYALDGSTKSELWGVSAMWGENERFTMGINESNKLTVRNGQIGTVVTNVAIARNAWNHYRMDLNYETDWAAVYFNNNFVGEYRMLGGANEHWGTALFNRSFSGNDGAIYDGLSIQPSSQPVPEPATIVGASVGLLALIRRKRNK